MAKVKCWEVTHPALGKTWVKAESWEQATVAAAKSWDVPWGKTVALMECARSYRSLSNVCPRCGRFFNSGETLCAACRLCIDTDRAEDKRRLLKTWYMGAKGAEFGT